MLITPIDLSTSDHIDQIFKNHILSNNTVNRIEFSGCTFKNCQFKESRWDQCAFKECEFQRCDFHLAQFPNTKFLDVQFIDCQLVGIDWSNSGLQRKSFLKTLDFRNCVINYSTFTALNLDKIRMTDCIVQNADFSDASLVNSVCTGTDFTNTRFASTDLTGADFRGARNYNIPVATNKITKAKFSLPEALTLLSSLDIEIRDPD